MSLKLTFKNLPQTFNCDRCTEVFNTPLHLKYHKFRVHNRRRPYVCKVCKKSFRRINELQLHRRRHRDCDPGFICTVCDERFANRASLTTHLGSHVHFDGDHECTYCSASFLYLAEAKLHVLLVHGDASVLPSKKPPRNNERVEELFCVKEGEGLKIKLQRKLSIDTGNDDPNTADHDFNPGSHTSDSGRGNSDMDEEDMRGGSQLLKSPTFIPRSADSAPRPASQRHVAECGLLSKPKLEVGQAQWGGSNIQPTLTSKDFLSKTKFASGLGLSRWGGGSGLSSPAQNSLLPGNSPSHSPLDRIASPHATNRDSSSHPPQKMLSGSSLFDQSKLPANGLANGSVFKNPNLPFTAASLNTAKFGSAKFGSSPFSQYASILSNRTLVQSMKLSSSMSSFTQSKLGNFGSNGFGGNPCITAPSVFNAAAGLVSNGRNGELKSDAIFGSKEKVRNMVAKINKGRFNAFERYASGGVSSANPFAEAMRRAKNPMPCQYSDSDALTDDSSFYSDSSYYSSQDSGVSGSSDEDADMSDIDSLSKSLLPPGPNIGQLSNVTSGPSDIPLEWNMPPLYAASSNLADSSPLPLPPYMSPTKSANSDFILPDPGDLSSSVSAAKPPDTTAAGLAGSAPAIGSPLQQNCSTLSYVEEEILPESHVSKVSSQRKSSSPRKSLSPRKSSPRKALSPRKELSHHAQSNHSLVDVVPIKQNGDIRGPEVTGNIDLDTPRLTLSIPTVLLSQATGSYKGRRKRRPSSRKQSSSSRTPNRSACPTPVYGSKTPSYSLNMSEYPCPPTPVLSSSKPITQVKTQTATISSIGTKKTAQGPRIRAPTKPEALEKMRKQGLLPPPPVKCSKPKIGPKSYMRRVNGRVLSDSEDESKKGMFQQSELQPRLSARADNSAPYLSRFKQNQKYLLFLRRRAIDLVLSLFPNIRIGGSFCFDSDDVDGLLDYVTMSLENKDSSRRCMDSQGSKRKHLNVSICTSSKKSVRQLHTKICKLIRLVLPSLTLNNLKEQGVHTMSALIHKIIVENS